MTGNIKIGVIGGDLRQKRVAQRLGERYECAVWGIDSIPGTAVRCASWQSAVKGADAVVLPLPVSRDGEKLNTDAGDISLSDIITLVKTGSAVFGGMIPQDLRAMIAERGAVAVDYYDSEVVQIKNAVPTAEGALSAIIEEMPMTVYGMSATVTGYGRCARTLCERLVSLGATVYTVARRDTALAWAGIEGCIPVPLGEYLTFPHDTDIIVNTVPTVIFDEEVVSGLDSKTVYFELAGGDGGIDRQAAEKYGLKIVPLPSLPGKTSPETAGDIIANEILAHLDGRFGGSVEK